MKADKLTFDDLLGLEVGSVIEAGVLMPRLSSERVTHRVESVDPEKDLVVMRSYYYGIYLGELAARPNEKGGVTYTPVHK